MSIPSPTAVAPPLTPVRGLRSITIPRGQLDDSTGLLDYVARNDIHTWVRRGDGLVAFGESARFTASGPNRFAAAQEWWRTQLNTSTS